MLEDVSNVYLGGRLCAARQPKNVIEPQDLGGYYYRHCFAGRRKHSYWFYKKKCFVYHEFIFSPHRILRNGWWIGTNRREYSERGETQSTTLIHYHLFLSILVFFVQTDSREDSHSQVGERKRKSGGSTAAEKTAVSVSSMIYRVVIRISEVRLVVYFQIWEWRIIPVNSLILFHFS